MLRLSILMTQVPRMNKYGLDLDIISYFGLPLTSLYPGSIAVAKRNKEGEKITH